MHLKQYLQEATEILKMAQLSKKICFCKLQTRRPTSLPSSIGNGGSGAVLFWRYYLQNKVMAVLAQFYFGVLAALAQLAVLTQFYFGGSTSIDPPHPPGRVCTPKYFFSFPPKYAPNASTMRSSGSASSSGLH